MDAGRQAKREVAKISFIHLGFSPASRQGHLAIVPLEVGAEAEAELIEIVVEMESEAQAEAEANLEGSGNGNESASGCRLRR